MQATAFTHLYRIHTEYSADNQRIAEKLMTISFESFNISRGTGYWKGQREDSMVIELMGTIDNKADIYMIAQEIRRTNKQEAIFVSVTEITGNLLY